MFAFFYIRALLVVILCVIIAQRSSVNQQARYFTEVSSVGRMGVA